MKKVFFLMLISALLISCEGSSTQVEHDSTTVTTVDTVSSQVTVDTTSN